MHYFLRVRTHFLKYFLGLEFRTVRQQLMCRLSISLRVKEPEENNLFKRIFFACCLGNYARACEWHIFRKPALIGIGATENNTEYV
jgi:hypothetical protein